MTSEEFLVYNRQDKTIIVGHKVEIMHDFGDVDDEHPEKLEIPEGVVEISEDALSDIESEEIVFPSTLKILGTGCLRDTQIRKVVIPKSVVEISNEAFYGSYVTELIFEEGSALETIEDGAFSDCHIQELTIPPSVKTIGEEAFSGNSIIKLKLNKGIDVIGANAFFNNDLRELYLPSTITNTSQVGILSFASNSNLDLIVIVDKHSLSYALDSLTPEDEVILIEHPTPEDVELDRDNPTFMLVLARFRKMCKYYNTKLGHFSQHLSKFASFK